jgi:hypothetical protein
MTSNILTSLEGITICKTLPKYVYNTGVWSYTSKGNDQYRHSSISIEEYFGMEDDYSVYFPSSSYQTQSTGFFSLRTRNNDFILNFTNKSVERFARLISLKMKLKKLKFYRRRKTNKTIHKQ